MDRDPSQPPADASQGRLIVDLDALAANYRLLRSVAQGAETAPVVKAEGYGLGAAQVAKRLWAEGARSFFVARLAEGEALRRHLGPGRPAVIYVLDGCFPGAAGRLHRAELTPVLNSFAQIDDWSAFAASIGAHLASALHIDTGLNRLGLTVVEAKALAQSSDRLRALELDLVISHLACGTDPESRLNAVQAERFARATALFPGVRRSLASSGGAFLGPPYHLDMVRPGISLYGGGPFGRPDARLATVATFLAPILQVRSVSPGETIGYGATFRATRPMRIAIVAVGYADGVLRAASPRGYGWLQGARCDVVGRISMDLIALDVTDLEAAQPDALQGGALQGGALQGGALQPGACVELIGPNVPVDLAAEAAGTISLELLSRIGARSPRSYTGAID